LIRRFPILHRVTAALAAVLVLAGPAAALVPQAGLPDIACTAPRDAVPGGAPATRVWTGTEDGAESWTPPACTGWTTPGYRVVVEISGAFRYAGTVEGLLTRVGAISRLPEMKYWSVTDGGWEQLVTAATALSSPDPDDVRGDFTAADLTPGATVHFAQEDNRSSGQVVYRLRIVEATAERLVLASENVTDVRYLLLTIADPGALQAFHVMEKTGEGVWSYRLVSRTGLGASSLVTGRAESLLNRAEALFDFMADRLDEGTPAPAGF